MGYYVHLSVVFSCDQNEPLAELAKACLPELDEEDIYQHEACWFLEHLTKRTGRNMGPKGGILTWGITGNYTDPEKFVKALIPFWKSMLADVNAGCHSFEHILVFYEREDSERAHCFEISAAEDFEPCRSKALPELVIKHHALPFCWNQL